MFSAEKHIYSEVWYYLEIKNGIQLSLICIRIENPFSEHILAPVKAVIVIIVIRDVRKMMTKHMIFGYKITKVFSTTLTSTWNWASI